MKYVKDVYNALQVLIDYGYADCPINMLIPGDWVDTPDREYHIVYVLDEAVATGMVSLVCKAPPPITTESVISEDVIDSNLELP